MNLNTHSGLHLRHRLSRFVDGYLRLRDLRLAPDDHRGMAEKLLKDELAKLLHDTSVRLGGPRAYWDGIPAAVEVDDIHDLLSVAGIPEEIDGWPLTPSQRIKHLLSATGVTSNPPWSFDEPV